LPFLTAGAGFFFSMELIALTRLVCYIDFEPYSIVFVMPMKEKIREILAERPWQPMEDSGDLTQAAVLIPMYCKEGEVHILFTKRTEAVRHHKGQISFPGGVFSRRDRDLLATALRETHEEVGVDPGHVEVLGKLDQSRTITDYVITPYVASIPYPYPFVPNPVEVAEIIEVPAAFLLDDANLVLGPIELEEDVVLDFEQIHFNGHVIWGATLRILQQFRSLLGPQFSNHPTCDW